MGAAELSAALRSEAPGRCGRWAQPVRRPWFGRDQWFD